MSQPGSSSISNHPAFRWAVAVWFAALLGGGLFVMPRTIHRMIGERLGAGDLPDSTLRIAIAIAAGMIGFVLGLLIAGRGRAPIEEWDEGYEARHENADGFASDPDGPALAAWEDVPAHEAAAVESPGARVFSAREELGGEGIAAPHHLVEAEDEPIEPYEDPQIVPEPAPASRPGAAPLSAPPVAPPQAIGDLPLSALTARLERAMTGARTEPVTAAPGALAWQDPTEPNEPAPEEALRSALDKLSRFRRED